MIGEAGGDILGIMRQMNDQNSQELETMTFEFECKHWWRCKKKKERDTCHQSCSSGSKPLRNQRCCFTKRSLTPSDFSFPNNSSTHMSNHPENLDIYDSTGPPAGILATSAADPDEPSTMISVMQDISTFGIAGRIWDRYQQETFCGETKGMSSHLWCLTFVPSFNQQFICTGCLPAETHRGLHLLTTLPHPTRILLGPQIKNHHINITATIRHIIRNSNPPPTPDS